MSHLAIAKATLLQNPRLWLVALCSFSFCCLPSHSLFASVEVEPSTTPVAPTPASPSFNPFDKLSIIYRPQATPYTQPLVENFDRMVSKQTYPQPWLIDDGLLIQTKQNNEVAVIQLFWHYLSGYGLPAPDRKHAYTILAEALAQNPSHALLSFYIARCHLLGLGTPVDVKQAKQFYVQAFSQGFIEAILKLYPNPALEKNLTLQAISLLFKTKLSPSLNKKKGTLTPITDVHYALMAQTIEHLFHWDAMRFSKKRSTPLAKSTLQTWKTLTQDKSLKRSFFNWSKVSNLGTKNQLRFAQQSLYLAWEGFLGFEYYYSKLETSFFYHCSLSGDPSQKAEEKESDSPLDALSQKDVLPATNKKHLAASPQKTTTSTSSPKAHAYTPDLLLQPSATLLEHEAWANWRLYLTKKQDWTTLSPIYRKYDETLIVKYQPQHDLGTLDLENLTHPKTLKEHLYRSAQLKLPEALFELGTCFYYGLQGFPRNEQKAFHYLKQAIQKQYQPAVRFASALIQQGVKKKNLQ